MKTIFAQLYSRIMDFFQGEKGEQTSQCAANRLQVILMHDRTKLDAVTMGKMREELIEVFSKYVIIDKEELEIGLKSEGDSVALMLNIPIIRAKTEEELAEALKEQEEDEHADETVEETEEETSEEEQGEEEKDEETSENSDDEQEETVEEITETEVEEPKTEEKNNKKTK
ncbi:cell division topological specificity factor MinE [bacterium]|nr:cell division topological specificity factor MinE [bacterium]